MYWHDCNKEPPVPEAEYEVLVLDHDMYHGARWLRTSGKYYQESHWDLWIDGFGWSSDSGYTPSYWIELPSFPPPLMKGRSVVIFMVIVIVWLKKICPDAFAKGIKINVKSEEFYYV